MEFEKYGFFEKEKIFVFERLKKLKIPPNKAFNWSDEIFGKPESRLMPNNDEGYSDTFSCIGFHSGFGKFNVFLDKKLSSSWIFSFFIVFA